METSLHRQLKEAYAGTSAILEAPVGRYRIDVVRDDELIEIQHGSLAAIRDKVRDLLRAHRVLVVKPIVRRTKIVKHDERGGAVIGRRFSPKRGRLIDVFEELVHFMTVFPHQDLTLEVVMVDVEEWRYPGHGRRRRRRDTDHVVEDRRLVEVHPSVRLRTAADLRRLLPTTLPESFDTTRLADVLETPRWKAQRIAYCLRETGAIATTGKRGNAWVYQVSGQAPDAA